LLFSFTAAGTKNILAVVAAAAARCFSEESTAPVQSGLSYALYSREKRMIHLSTNKFAFSFAAASAKNILAVMADLLLAIRASKSLCAVHASQRLAFVALELAIAANSLTAVAATFPISTTRLAHDRVVAVLAKMRLLTAEWFATH
jgi:hypothetical protein